PTCSTSASTARWSAASPASSSRRSPSSFDSAARNLRCVLIQREPESAMAVFTERRVALNRALIPPTGDRRQPQSFAERIDATMEEAYWRENYLREPYYERGSPPRCALQWPCSAASKLAPCGRRSAE